MSSEVLQQAYRLIRDGSREEAARLLVPIVRTDPSNADAWWLLANALDNPEQQRRALKRTLSLRPNDERARQMLNRLQSGAEFADEVFYEEPIQRASGRGGGTIFLALVGLLVVLSCGACLFAFTVGLPNFTQIVSEIEVTVPVIQFAQTVATATPAPPPTVPADLQKRGSIEVGQTVSQSVDTFRDDGWNFSGEANQHVIVEVDAVDPDLDPLLYLYAPDQLLIAENDDIDGSTNRNARIDITLPTTGVYTIRVSAFVQGGAYHLSVTQP